jgi:hypothetical protein
MVETLKLVADDLLAICLAKVNIQDTVPKGTVS